MSTGFLHISGTQIVDSCGNVVKLRGAGLGGWMNMENFISGFPGHENQHRAAMLKVLGKDKYDFFFDRWLTHFFTDADAKFFASLGLNCLRVPFNYRHFEDDMRPRELKKEGFKHLDRVVGLCAKNGIYTILDLHSAPGGQNQDWHCDNNTNEASFWTHKDFQDRALWLWTQLAEHYKHNPWVAGYNPLNEPADSEQTRLQEFYTRAEATIHAIDPSHILFLDGNTYASDFSAFTTVLPNCAYSLHDYSPMGFPAGERYTGTPEQKAQIEASYVSKASWMNEHAAAIWNGEFGPVYDGDESPEKEVVNQERLNLLGEQLRVYGKYDTPWSIWTYKDVGAQGMVYTDLDGEWMKLVGGFMKKKRETQVDAWGYHPSDAVRALFKPILEWIDTNAPEAKNKYPWTTQRHVERLVKHCYLAESLEMEFARLFEGKTLEELEELAASFALENCVQRDGLNTILREHAGG